MNKALYALGGCLLVAFAGFAYTSFQQSLTPYVNFAQARETERTVQVAGALVQGSSSYDTVATALLFTLKDTEKHDQIDVAYYGIKPANFEDAISIVAIGHWDENHKRLEADRLLVKCPSKYQGVEEQEYS